MIKAKSLGIAAQAFGIRQLTPDSKIVIERDYRLTWTYEISPSPLGDRYGVKVIYAISESPKAYVVTPKPLTLAKGKLALPHCYNQKEQLLCLYYPDGRQWNSTMSLAKTVIPWMYDWLYHYEIWVGTGEWNGGGVHLEKVASGKNKSTNKLPFNTKFSRRK
ncbi:hypothetical protein [Dyadobacter sp. 22481]|uniref:hypothetical protein n=1 Tax=Dyadobacter sp. 22481 TaxID=3453926 RepID=UPI003F84388F